METTPFKKMYLLLKIGDFPGNHVSFQEAILFDCHILPYQIPRRSQTSRRWSRSWTGGAKALYVLQDLRQSFLRWESDCAWVLTHLVGWFWVDWLVDWLVDESQLVSEGRWPIHYCHEAEAIHGYTSPPGKVWIEELAANAQSISSLQNVASSSPLPWHVTKPMWTNVQPWTSETYHFKLAHVTEIQVWTRFKILLRFAIYNSWNLNASCIWGGFPDRFYHILGYISLSGKTCRHVEYQHVKITHARLGWFFLIHQLIHRRIPLATGFTNFSDVDLQQNYSPCRLPKS